TISPGRSVRFTFSRTTSSSPSGLRKDLHTPCTSSNGARLSAAAVAFTDDSPGALRSPSADAELALGARVQRAPEDAVQRDDEQAQHHGTEHRALEVACTRGIGNIRTQSVRGQRLLAPAGDLRDDARVPRTARGRDGPGHVERKDGRQ